MKTLLTTIALLMTITTANAGTIMHSDGSWTSTHSSGYMNSNGTWGSY